MVADRFKYSKQSNTYQSFKDDRMLDRFIREQGIRSGSSKLSSVRAEEFERDVSDKHLPLNESIGSYGDAYVQPYSIPIPILRTSSINDSETKQNRDKLSSTSRVRFESDHGGRPHESPTEVSEQLVDTDSDYKDGDNNLPDIYSVIEPASKDVNTDGLALNVSDLKNPKIQVFHPVVHLPDANESPVV